MYIVISGYVAKGGGDLNPHRAARSLVYLWVPLVLITGLIRVRSWGMAVMEGDAQHAHLEVFARPPFHTLAHPSHRTGRRNIYTPCHVWHLDRALTRACVCAARPGTLRVVAMASGSWSYCCCCGCCSPFSLPSSPSTFSSLRGVSAGGLVTGAPSPYNRDVNILQPCLVRWQTRPGT